MVITSSSRPRGRRKNLALGGTCLYPNQTCRSVARRASLMSFVRWPSTVFFPQAGLSRRAKSLTGAGGLSKTANWPRSSASVAHCGAGLGPMPARLVIPSVSGACVCWLLRDPRACYPGFPLRVGVVQQGGPLSLSRPRFPSISSNFCCHRRPASRRRGHSIDCFERGHWGHRGQPDRSAS